MRTRDAFLESLWTLIPVALTGLIAYLTPLNANQGGDLSLLGLILAVLKGIQWYLTGVGRSEPR